MSVILWRCKRMHVSIGELLWEPFASFDTMSEALTAARTYALRDDEEPFPCDSVDRVHHRRDTDIGAIVTRWWRTPAQKQAFEVDQARMTLGSKLLDCGNYSEGYTILYECWHGDIDIHRLKTCECQEGFVDVYDATTGKHVVGRRRIPGSHDCEYNPRSTYTASRPPSE